MLGKSYVAFLRFLKLYSAIQPFKTKKLSVISYPNLLGETNLFFKLEKNVCKTQRMPRIDPTFHFIRLPKVFLGPALNSFKYLSKFQLHNKSLVFKGCNFVKNDLLPFRNAHAHLDYVCNIYAKVEVNCLKTVGEVDYSNSIYAQP